MRTYLGKMGKIKDILKQENVSKTFCSKAFVWCWLTIVFVCWATGGWIAGFIMAAVAACVILCLCKDSFLLVFYDSIQSAAPTMIIIAYFLQKQNNF